jgi:hypothetical protein
MQGESLGSIVNAVAPVATGATAFTIEGVFTLLQQLAL